MATSKRPRRSFDLRFEISNLDYPGIHVHIASNGLRGHGDLLMTSGFLEIDTTTTWPIMIHRPACFAVGKNVFCAENKEKHYEQ